MSFLLFWHSKPYTDPEIEDFIWFNFINEMGWWIVGCVVATVIVTIIIYWSVVAKKKIREPIDLFKPLAPLRWQWLAVLPSLITFARYLILGKNLLGIDEGLIYGRAITAGVATGIYTAMLTYILICIFTYFKFPQFRYRPVGLLYRIFKIGVKKPDIK